MSNDDLLFRHRQRLFARAGEVGVSQACRELGFHRSTYYRWKGRVEREGLEILRPRERRRPRMPNQLPPWLEERVVAFCLGQPGLGPRRVASQLRLPEWGGQPISASGVFKVLRRHGLSSRRKRLSLVAGYAAPPEPERAAVPEPLHLDVGKPGDLVQFDCFHIGRLSGTKGRVWQYTAITSPAPTSGPRSTRLSSTQAPPSPRPWPGGWPTSWPRQAGSSKRFSPTTAQSSAPSSSAARCVLEAPRSGSYVPGGPRPMAAWSGSSAPSSRNAGVRPSLALWCPSPRLYAATSSSTSTTTTGTVATPDEEATGIRPAWQSTVLERCAHGNGQLSPYLGSRTV